MYIRLSALLLPLAILSCDKEEAVILDPPMTISMDVRSAGTGDDYAASIRRQEVMPLLNNWNTSLERWRRLADGSVELSKQLTFTVDKGGGRETRVDFYLTSEETSPELLQLSEAGDDWAYLDPRDEAERFYRSLSRSRFDINHRMLTSESDHKPVMNVWSVREAHVNGDTLSYVTIRFSGELRGAYDPAGEFGVYIVEDGEFRGVID